MIASADVRKKLRTGVLTRTEVKSRAVGERGQVGRRGGVYGSGEDRKVRAPQVCRETTDRRYTVWPAESWHRLAKSTMQGSETKNSNYSLETLSDCRRCYRSVREG